MSSPFKYRRGQEVFQAVRLLLEPYLRVCSPTLGAYGEEGHLLIKEKRAKRSPPVVRWYGLAGRRIKGVFWQRGESKGISRGHTLIF